jgi:nucleoside-diphosphate kinase
MKNFILPVIVGAILTGQFQAAFADAPDTQKVASVEQTLSIIKPNGVRDNHVGAIIERFEQNGLRVAAVKMVLLSKDQAQQFYVVHKDRPFYNDLVTSMTSGPIVAIVLEGDNAVAKNREIMGPTDPKKAPKGTIRGDFAVSITENAVHGSDSVESAKKEIPFFFTPSEIQNRFLKR